MVGERGCVAIVLALLFTGTPLHAAVESPVSAVLTVSQDGSQAVLTARVSNKGSDSAKVDLRIFVSDGASCVHGQVSTAKIPAPLRA
jgi:hypothetical protein